MYMDCGKSVSRSVITYKGDRIVQDFYEPYILILGICSLRELG